MLENKMLLSVLLYFIVLRVLFDCRNADELPSFISISDDSLCEGNICLTEDLKNEDFSSLSVVKQEYISDEMTLSTSRGKIK